MLKRKFKLKKNLKKKNFKKNLKRKRIILMRGLSYFNKHNPSLKKIKFNKILNLKKIKTNFSVSIKITPNNIFCLLKNIKKQKTILLLSAGILKLKISKKKLKFASKIIIQNFIEKIKKRLKNKKVIITMSGPKKIRKFLLKQLIFSLKKTKLLINAINKKIFNGCRVKKKRKKKQKGKRVFK